MIARGISHMQQGLFIGEICKQAGCTPRTVRHYEAEGLLIPIGKTAGGRKRYDQKTVSIISTIQILKRLGYSLKDIRTILRLTESDNTKNRHLTKKLRQVINNVLRDIDSEMELLTLSRKKVWDLIGGTKKCGSCKSPDCGPCAELKRLRTLGMLNSPLQKPAQKMK
jgi:DNA-binding transcriptional MerR regulator